ncbi:MAG: hypothetical protein ABJP70_11470 [Erythrobacter sp.]
MTDFYRFFAIAGAALALGAPGIAAACVDPSEQWYRDVSDVIFDGSAVCEPEKESCRIRVSRVIKNPDHLAIEDRWIDIDFYSWYDEYYANNPNTIVLACGVPRFKPDEERFRARFYANLDDETQELVVRRYLPREQRRD